MFKNPFSFNGRIRRLEYGLSLIVLYLMVMALGIISDLIASSREWDIMNSILWIPLLWFLIAQRTKRCHDKGVSGTWQIVPFYDLILLFAESDPGFNEYGTNPKGI